MLINRLVRDTGSPPIPEAQAWLARYDGRHGPAIDLSQAVPGVPPHPELLERLGAAAARAETAAYGPIEGDAPLREAYAAHAAALFGARLDAADVVVTAGCNQAFAVTMMALAAHGDAVLLPTPWYFNHAMMLHMLGIEARPLPCRAERGFVPDPDEAARLIDGRVRAVVLVTPNNPTGAIYPSGDIAAFAMLARERDISLVIDETYRDFLPPGRSRPHELLADPAWRDHVVGLYSFSKAYCVPGHRLGAILAGPTLRDGLVKILDSLQICPPRPGQAALAWGIGALAAWRDANRGIMAARSLAFRAAMERLGNGWAIDAIGAYFAYVRHPFASEPAAAVAERLAADHGVLMLPGSYFGPGQDGHLRVAFANVDVERLDALADRLGLAVG